MTTKVSSSLLTSTGVTAGTYGSSSSIPAITIGLDGRVTLATTNTVSNTFTGSVDSGVSFTDTTVTNIVGTGTGSVGKIGTISNHPLSLITNNVSRATLSTDGILNVPNKITTTTQAIGTSDNTVATTEFVTNSDRPVITQVIQYGWNSILFLSEGKVYEAHGSAASFAQSTSGRGLSGVVYPVSLDCITQVIIPDTSPIVKISGGNYQYAAALTASGKLYTWGNNANGECGLGHTSAVGVPTYVMSGVADLYEIINPSSYGYDYRNFIKKTDGTVWGCGYNANGGLGIGNVTNQSSFVQITGAGTNPKFVGNIGGHYGCLFIQKSDNTIWGAGYNYMGVLGTGAFTPSPYYISSLTNVTTNWNNGDNTMVIQQMAGGCAWYTTAADSAGNVIMLLDNGTSSLVKTCGYNANGSIGNGGTGNVATPNTVTGISGRIIQIGSAGSGPSSVYALNSAGTLYAWGYNASGQLANGNTTQQNLPVSVASGVEKFYLGEPQNTYQYYIQLFVKKTDGYVYSAGYNNYSALGVGDTANRSTLTMVRLPYTTGTWKFGSFSTTGSVTSIIAISPKNTIYGWGYNGNYGLSYNYSDNITAPIIYNLKRGD